ncbi:MAG: ribonuclease E activity regulator RraA [Gammaproteobacteria bacterium]|nr:ribonuclease E activity regulator RraA [Gammaproteobacteria bacterium]
MTFKTADLSDTSESKLQIVRPGLRNFGGKPRFYGEIVTIKSHGDFSQLRELVRSPGAGRVLVVDNDASMDCAMLGDLLAAAALENSWAGIVINGCIRDSTDIAAMAIGVKALATIPSRGACDGRGNVDIELQFLGASFRPGEFIYSDEDGIILSPDSLI